MRPAAVVDETLSWALLGSFGAVSLQHVQRQQQTMRTTSRPHSSRPPPTAAAIMIVRSTDGEIPRPEGDATTAAGGVDGGGGWGGEG